MQASPKRQLAEFIAKYTPEIGLLANASLKKMRALFFLTGAGLKDPQKLLKGSGSTVRRILISKPEALDDLAVRALMQLALQKSPKPIDVSKSGYIVIKSISPKQRPRRPAVG